MTRFSRIFLLALLYCVITAGNAVAAWSTNPTLNNAISTAANDQTIPTIIGDGSGGAIITWQDFRSGNYDIYAQRINAAGVVQWAADGVAISTAAGNEQAPTLTSDGSGGAIITWVDHRSGTNSDIYAQRINAGGAVQWTANGVAISTAAGNQWAPTLISDGGGGAIITWYDSRSDTGDIYAQRINAGGAVQWAANGVAVSTAAGAQQVPTIIGDGSGGAIITWQDLRSGTNNDIYAQKINAGGAVQWAANGVAISTAAGNQQVPTIIGDGSGGAIITWYDDRSDLGDIYAQRINAGGAVQWTADGVAISTAAGVQWTPTLISDGGGGAIITWRDYRSGAADIYAQRINAGGAVQWAANGVAISTAANNQIGPTITSDGSGGAIITWTDFRSGTNNDIYAQRINAGGAVQWAADGVAISSAASDQWYPTLTSDGGGGAIITWYDGRSGLSDIYAQRIDTNGALSNSVFTYTGPTATATGTATATVSAGVAGCSFTGTPQFVALNGSAPEGVTFPQGLFNFTLGGCTPGGTATLTMTYPSAVSAGTQYWKFGPTPGGGTNSTPHWYTIPATISGNTITFSITDGGLGDDDLLPNGTIVDQGGPGVLAATAIPTLSEWGIILLAGLLGLFGMGVMRRRSEKDFPSTELQP